MGVGVPLADVLAAGAVLATVPLTPAAAAGGGERQDDPDDDWLATGRHEKPRAGIVIVAPQSPDSSDDSRDRSALSTLSRQRYFTSTQVMACRRQAAGEQGREQR